MDRFVVVSGCSGGGKSTLIALLAERGHATVPEPGRRIVVEERASGGLALPWVDAAAFARSAVAMALADRAAAAAMSGTVFFDRGMIDAAVALEHVTGEAVILPLGRTHRYHRRVFLVPPWPEIYVNDGERLHGLSAAIEEYDRLAAAYALLGYEICVLPKVDAAARADMVVAALAA
jgi:predicted ATPase